jgi:hypothetical protein
MTASGWYRQTFRHDRKVLARLRPYVGRSLRWRIVWLIVLLWLAELLVTLLPQPLRRKFLEGLSLVSGGFDY